MPVVDQLAAEYADRVDFVAPAWKSSFELTEARAEELFLSGEIKWGLDADEEIFGLYGVPYQPVTVLIAADRTVVVAWPGIRAEDEIREALENLIALTE
ncbi:MAG: TlpA family protein disulfide reductase [Acidimicrobiia bacterium]